MNGPTPEYLDLPHALFTIYLHCDFCNRTTKHGGLKDETWRQCEACKGIFETKYNHLTQEWEKDGKSQSLNQLLEEI